MGSGPGRRQIGAGAIAAAITAGVPRDARADLQALESAAHAEGTLTWYTGQTDAETAELLGRTFTARYPGIKVEVIRTTGQVAYQRLMLDIKNKTPQCDVFSTTDISHMPILKERHELTEYTPENAAALLPPFLALSDAGYSYVTNASRYFLIYNTNLVKAEDAPKNWTDLLDPKWKGFVATGHPAFSGCTGVWCVAMRKLYGWEYFEKLAKNNPRIGRSAVDPVTLMTAGEVRVGLGSANNIYRTMDKGNPLAISVPTDGLSVCVTPSAIPANAPHPAAARLFMEWLLSEGYSKIVAGDGSEPIRTGVPPRPDEPPLASQKVIPLTVAEIRKGIPEVIEAWRETFGN
jgi:iron(III) transport system substrate-binding protein